MFLCVCIYVCVCVLVSVCPPWYLPGAYPRDPPVLGADDHLARGRDHHLQAPPERLGGAHDGLEKVNRDVNTAMQGSQLSQTLTFAFMVFTGRFYPKLGTLGTKHQQLVG